MTTRDAPDALLLGDRPEDRDNGVLEHSAGVEVRLRERPVADSVAGKPVEIVERRQGALAREAVECPKQHCVKPPLSGIFEQSSELELICLTRKTGAILWRRAVAAPEIEKTQTVSNPATGTPAVDGQRVYVYFGSNGLAAFDFEGNQKWTVPLPPAKTRFGSGTSPIVAGDLVILHREEITGGYLLAVDRADGHTVWKTAYDSMVSRSTESYSTPVVWRNQLVLHRSGSVDAYDLKSGKRLWWVAVFDHGNKLGCRGPRHCLRGDVFPAWRTRPTRCGSGLRHGPQEV